MRRCGRRGYTLVEAMIASALLATSVIGVSGTILSSYAHDEQSAAQGDAVTAAESLMDELTALPFVAGSSTDVGLMDFASYSDTTTPGQSTVATAKAAQNKGATSSSQAVQSGAVANVGLVGNLLNIVGGLLGGGSSSSSTGSGTSTGGSGGGTTTTTTTSTATITPTTPPRTAARTVNVVREDTINGTASSTGDLAIVTVDVTIGNGQKLRMRRLMSSTEATSSIAGN